MGHVFGQLLAQGLVKYQNIESNTVFGMRDILIQLGCWKPEVNQGPRPLRCCIWLSHYTFCSSVILTLVLCPVSIYQFREMDAIMIMEPAASMFVTGLSSATMASLLCRGDKFSDMMVAYNDLKSFDFQKDDLSQFCVDEMKWFSKFAFRYFFMIFPVMCVSLITGFPMYAMENREFPLRFWFPYDLQAPLNFEFTLLSFFTLISFGVIAFFITNTLCIALLMETICHLMILNYNLQKCVRKLDNLTDEDSIQPEFVGVENDVHRSMETEMPINSFKLLENCEDSEYLQGSKFQMYKKKLEEENKTNYRLKTCVQHHQTIIRFMETFNKAYNPIFFQHLNCSLAPCILAAFGVANATVVDSRSFLIFGVLVVHLFDQGVYCWMGEKVNEQSELLRDAVFSCDWLRTSDGFKRSMRIMMSRSNQPLVVKVAGFIPLNMKTFSQIIQLIYNFYMSLTATLEMKPRDL